MKRLLFLLLISTSYLTAQVGIGTISPNALLEIESTNQATPANTDGILIPKIDEFPASNPGANQDGMLVYATGAGSVAKGFYFWDNGATAWVLATGAKNINDLADGISDAIGSSVFLGVDAGVNDDGSNNQNTSIGYQSLFSNNTGNSNTALGYQSMRLNTSGRRNVGIGHRALLNNIDGDFNTSVGFGSLLNSTSGDANTAIGNSALEANTTGFQNTAGGFDALSSNTSGRYNTAFGSNALIANTIGEDNTAIGRGAGGESTGDRNLFLGNYSGSGVNAGDRNVMVGQSAGSKTTPAAISGSVFLGYTAGRNEANDDRLYIENSDADADNALIYGEFDNDILRTNGTLQIGNPASGGYTMPTTAGSANQILRSDGSGGTSWVNASAIAPEKIDDLTDGKSDNDGTNNGSSIYLGVNAGNSDDVTDNQNIGIGLSSLFSNTSGYSDTAVGYSTLRDNTTGYQNTAIGHSALQSNTTGYSNTAVGSLALQANEGGISNAAFGRRAMEFLTGGLNNTAIGTLALQNNTTGDRNTVVGSGAGLDAQGDENVIIGSLAMRYNTAGNRNTVVGSNASFNVLGDENVIIGVGLPVPASRTISNSVIIGSYAGRYETNSNRLYIENTDSTSPLIYGEFDNDVLGFNGDVGINTQSPSASLHVNHQSGSSSEGFVLSNVTDADEWRMYVQWNSNTLAMFFNNTNVGNFDDVSGTYSAISDRRMKKNIQPIGSVLERVNQLEVVDYNFVHQKDSGKYTGLIAQEVRELFPNLVSVSDDETENLTMDYSGFGVLAIKAIQEQQQQIDELKNEIEELKALIKHTQGE